MGAGSSVSLKKARESEEFAAKAFAKMDANGDGVLSVIELYDSAVQFGEAIDGDWSLDKIKEALARFDENGDGKLDLEEFKHALSQLEEVTKGKRKSKAKKAGSSRNQLQGNASGANLKRAFKRSFTFKKMDIATLAQEATDAKQEQEEQDAEEEAASAAAEALVMSSEAPQSEEERLAQKQTAFWAKQDELTCWKVPLGLDRSKMPWLADGETGLEAAMARCRSEEYQKTPLLVDGSYESVIDTYFAKLGEKEGALVTLDAKSMFLDERAGTRDRKTVMNDTRKLLVQAMRDGSTFHVKLENKVTEFTGGNYCNEDDFPIAIFDQRVVDDLHKNYSKSAPVPPGLDVSNWHGLYGQHESTPIAKILRDKDLDNHGHFFVGDGFRVVVSTYFKPDEYVGYLRNSLPFKRLQGINPTFSPI